jgi:hypothetical protein
MAKENGSGSRPFKGRRDRDGRSGHGAFRETTGFRFQYSRRLRFQSLKDDFAEGVEEPEGPVRLQVLPQEVPTGTEHSEEMHQRSAKTHFSRRPR